MKSRNFISRLMMLFAFCVPALLYGQDESETDTTKLGLPGDNLDLYAVLNLFQKSKTIEEFEKQLTLLSSIP